MEEHTTMMGFFDGLISRLFGGRADPGPTPAPAPTPAQQAEPTVTQAPPPPRRTEPAAISITTVDSGTFTAAITRHEPPAADVSEDEVSECVREHEFVLITDPPALKTGSAWWDEEMHKRRRRDGSEKAYAWLLPFVPLEIAKLERLQAAQEYGPHWATTLAKELRAIIRERRKAKEPRQDLLRALYGACIAADLYASLKFDGTQGLARLVDVDDLQRVSIDYGTMGYQRIESLSKTDIKWLVEAFGEPVQHQSVDSIWPHLRRDAVARHCWAELRSANETAKHFGRPEKTMQEWLDTNARQHIGYKKEWQERVKQQRAVAAERAAALETAWAATRQPFVVADLETTGLNAGVDEVLELAAVRVAADGTIVGEFAMLVRPSVRVPIFITGLTGITQDAVDREGWPLAEAMRAFTAFVGAHPIFFHNAPFDQGFLRAATNQTGVDFANPIHDTLPLARQAWPSLDTHKLSALAEYVGTQGGAHRALADSKTALAVLLAARKKRDLIKPFSSGMERSAGW